MNIKEIIQELIPPSDRDHRDGFDNAPIIDKLNDEEKRLVEDFLIDILDSKKNEPVERLDTLIIETLAYLKSEKSLPVFYNILEKCSNELIGQTTKKSLIFMIRLITATAIFEISNDKDMIDIAISSLKGMDNTNNPYYIYNLIAAFFYLIKFKNPEINALLKKYTKHRELLVSYNAKRYLGE